MGKLKIIKKITIGVLVIVGILNVADAIYAASFASATDQSFTAEVNIEPSATVTIATGSADGSINLNVTPSRNGTFGSTYRSASVNTPVSVSVYTNSTTSFDVKMTTTSTVLTSGTNTIPTLPASCASGCVSTDNAFLNKWGYSTDGTTYYPVNTTNTIQTITTNTGSTSTTASVYFGMKLTGATAPGTYTNTLNFSVAPTSP